MLRQVFDTGTFRTRIAPMADFDLGALSFSERKNRQRGVVKAISA
ncbi:hypothetical protein [Nioella nitratireducens]|nr:hypothetical protein [Nioella nitratireducens]